MTTHNRGAMSYQAGLAAETIVENDYARHGCPVLARRWRGKGGEIDLILQDGDGLIFVEVKTSKTHARAASHVSPRQIARIMTAAEEFVATQPRGGLTDMRFDVALVDGTGHVRVIENAFMT